MVDAEDGGTDVLQPTPLSDAALVPPRVVGYGTASFYGETLEDEKGRVDFIRGVERLVRHCIEMKRYRVFLSENLDMGRCSVLTGLSEEDCAAAGVELHHHPLTLFDVVELVLGQMEADGDRLTSLSVAQRVMAEHWLGRVGLVPLTKSLHEMVHAGQLHIDPRMVYGDWAGLLDSYRSGITEHLAAKLRAEAATWGNPALAASNAALLEVLPQRWAVNPPTAARMLEGPSATPDETE